MNKIQDSEPGQFEAVSNPPKRSVFEQIRRDMLAARVGPTGHGFRIVGDRKFIERVLKFANGNMSDWGDVAETIAEFDLRPGTATYTSDDEALPSLRLTFSDPVTGPKWQRLYSEKPALFLVSQNALIDCLEIALRNLVGARRTLAEKISKQLSKIVVVTFPEFRSGKLMMEPYAMVDGVDEACAYALALLLDESRPEGDSRSFGERLRRCALSARNGGTSDCQKWFLSYAGEAGGPLRKYCSDECRLKAGAATGSERVRKHRATRIKK